MESMKKLLGEECLQVIHTELERLLHFVEPFGYQVKDPLVSEEVHFHEYKKVHFSALFFNPVLNQSCELSARWLDFNNQWEVEVDLRGEKGYALLRSLLRDEHQNVDMEFLSFEHTANIEELRKRVAHSVDGWIHALQNELNPDFTGKVWRFGKRDFDKNDL